MENFNLGLGENAVGIKRYKLGLFVLFCGFIVFIITVYLFFFRDRIYCYNLKKELEWVSKEIEKIMIKNSHEGSEIERKRLESLGLYKKALRVDLYYAKNF